ncbi:MAG: NAD-dependent 4,6-dehydratase LegB [Rhodospirillaceae bacterium]|jgi:NAD dependent epimerase/dehydratase|nr:NAD-dependent 4,6-dehydratase LegB [Rhodospirillaceae bacterium]
MMSLGKVLVTGADGFIGSHLTEALVRAGHDVRAFVLYNSFNSWGWLDHTTDDVRDALDIFAGDVRDPHGMRTAMQGCNTVLHLAALISIPYSYHSPAAYIDTNVKGTLNVVQTAKDLEVSRVIVTSTSEVYGTAQFVPITEEHPLQGQSPYSASKIGADHIALSFHRAFGTPVSVVRPFNTYGPRQSARAVIPTIITQILAGKKEIKLGSLHPTRDFNYVEDTVSGFLAMASSEASVGETINIGSNFEVAIGETVDMIKEIMSSNVKIMTDDERIRPEASEVERLWASNAKAKEIMNWSPAFGGRDGFKRGLEKTIAWFSDPAHAPLYKAHLYNI